MNKDLHDIDELFRSKLEGHEEIPSAGVKKNLKTELDKKDNRSNKRKFIGWKRTALLLLLLVTGFIFYESGILKKDSGWSGGKNDDKQMNYPFGKKPKETYQNNTAAKNSDAIKIPIDNTHKKVREDNIFISPKPKEINIPVTVGIKNETDFKKSSTGNKIVVQNSNPEKEQSSSAVIRHNPDKNINSFLKIEEQLPKQKTNPFQSANEISRTQMLPEFANSIRQLQAIKDSILKNYIAKNIKEKKGKFFKPFWMLTAFAAYERSGYRLDSDIPNNITSIKHSEVQEPSFSLGVLTTRQLKKYWGLQTGLIYSQNDVGITPQKLYALQDPTGDIAFKYIISTGYAYIKPGLGAQPSIGDSLTTTDGKHRLKSISVPLAVKYSIGKNKLTFNPGLGIEANFLTSAKIETEIERPFSPEIVFINKLEGAKRFYVSVVADAEFRYKLNNKLSVSFRPAIRLATSSITKNNVVETFPRSVGVGMGLTWKF